MEQWLQRLALQVEGDGDKAGRAVRIGVLHVPLIGAVDGHIPLPQQQLVSAGHGVQASLVHISQFQHGVTLAPEEEPPFLLLVEEGVYPTHLDSPAKGPGLCWGSCPGLAGVARAGDFDGAFGLVGQHRKDHAGMQAHRLIQIEVAVLRPVGDGQQAHTSFIVQIHRPIGAKEAYVVGFHGDAFRAGSPGGIIGQESSVGCKG